MQNYGANDPKVESKNVKRKFKINIQKRKSEKESDKYFASSNPHPPHSRAYDRYNKLLRITRDFDSKFPSALLDTKQNQTSELVWRDTGRIHWRILAGRSGSILAGYSAGSTSKGYSADTRRDPLASYSKDTQRDTRRDPPAGCSGGILGGYTGELLWRDLEGSTGSPLRWDTQRDSLASRSGGILGGIHWPAALAGYWAGSTGQLLWRDTRRDPLTTRSIANADSNIKSTNPFLSGGEKMVKT